MMFKNRLGKPGGHLLLKLASGISLVLLVCGSAYAQPANNDCTTAEVLPGSAPFPPYQTSVDGSGATLDPTDPILSCNTGDDGNQTVWFSYTPDASGEVDINTIGSTTAGGGELDTAHGAFVGTCGDLTEVACADFGLNDYMNFDVEAGTTYYIKVGQFAGGNNAGTYVINVAEPSFEAGLKILESVNTNTSAPLSEILASQADAFKGGSRGERPFATLSEVANFMRPEGAGAKTDENNVGSPVASSGNVRWVGPAEVLQVFQGGINDDNGEVLGGFIAPPDTVGDVGRDHFIQQFNLLTEIFDKDGNSVAGPFPTSTFFAGMPGNCAISDDGDPIVLYDEETDRWLVSQFLASFQDGLCIAISTSGDPMGTWHQHEFDFTGMGFPDYPKYGFATGAVNVMVNLFTPFQGSALGAIDKDELFAGVPATMALFTGGLSAQLAFGWVPGDNDGPVFDNTYPTFFTTLGGSGSTIFVGEIHPDWDVPENTTLGFAGIPVSPWDSGLCNAPRGRCIDQPGSGTTAGFNPNVPEQFQVITFLEGITDRMMHRGQTRDLGSRKQAVLSHTVDVDGTGHAGVRWYELWNQRDGGWTLKKEETYSPDGDHRWMPSIAMTARGDTCLGYSISSETTKPAIGITGRKGTSNHMNITETVAFAGDNVQRNTARWGDYSSMSIDPVDDTCWYTTEYALPTTIPFFSNGEPLGEIFGWGTQIIQYSTRKN